jgi:hypothetical protein
VLGERELRSTHPSRSTTAAGPSADLEVRE